MYKSLIVNIFLIGIFLSLIAVFGSQLGDLPYYIILIFVLFISVSFVLASSQGVFPVFPKFIAIKKLGYFDNEISFIIYISSFFIIFSWFYGVCIGFLNDVPVEYIFRNFFGLLLYGLFPCFLVINPSGRYLIITILLAGIVQQIFGMGSLVLALYENPSLFIGAVLFADSRSLYSVGYITIFPVLSIGLAGKFMKRDEVNFKCPSAFIRTIKSNYFLLFTILSLILPAMSKGFILAVFLMSITIFGLSILQFWFKTYGTFFNFKWHIIFVIIIILMALNFNDIILLSFSSQDGGNSLRSDQFKYIVDELSWWGGGLGSSLQSGYVRDDTGYAMELTYLNLIHKLGFFSTILFSSYFLTLALAAVRVVRGVYLIESIFVFGSMGYLVVGAGNPILLSAPAVILHVSAMFILVRPYLNDLRSS